MKYFFENLKNKVDFFLRQNLGVSRKKYSEENETKDDLFKTQELIEREKIIFEKFDLNYLKSNSTRQNYLENLYTIDFLDKYLGIDFKDEIKVLDIGCKNWFYAKGEYLFFKKYCKNLILDGIELDANRLYSSFYSRKEVAKFYTRNTNVNYIAGDFLEVNDYYDYMVWILPFVVKEPLLKWGLPIRYFKPEKMLKHAYDLLNENGKIFIINQGEAEYEIQKMLCKKLNIPFSEIDEVKSDFLEYEISRYAILIKK